MSEKLLQIVRILLAVIRAVSAALLAGSVAINFANIIGRYFLRLSISWAEESMLFLMVGCVFLGSALVTWSGRHIRMDIFVRMLPLPMQAALNIVYELVFLVTAVALVIFCWPVIQQLLVMDQRSMAANIPIAIPQAMIPLGLLCMAFFVIARLVMRRQDTDESSH